jgi:hypothetical protein
MITAVALTAPAVIMDARNKCGHDRRMEVFGDWCYKEREAEPAV